jgi:hypothetical protein
MRSVSQDGRRPPSSTLVEGKRYEMCKSRLQSRNFRLSARLAQQAAILFKALPRSVRATKAATKAGFVDLLRMAFFATD